jgi:TonB family protein
MMQTPAPRTPAQVQADAQTKILAQQAAGKQARAAEQARRAEAAQQLQQRQQQAQDQRHKMQLAKAQADADAKARQQAEAARVAQAEAQAANAAKARQEAAAPKVADAAPHTAAGPTREFSSRPISGGSPAYPSAYESNSRTGRVTVSCLITESGSPSGCHVLSSQGGIGFNNAVLSWLRSGQVRFAPILRNGEARAEQHSWSMTFEP